MATPSLRRNINRVRESDSARFQSLPLVARRFIAWTLEILIIVTSTLIPLGIGIYIQSHSTSEPVPLNPVLTVAETAIAIILNLPIDYSYQEVVPLTNLFWSIALVAPLVLSVWQLYLLAKTGSTLPKRWFGVRVLAVKQPPGIKRVLIREVVGCWGLPLLLAYLLWLSSGASSLNILIAVCCSMILAEGMSARFDYHRRCLHDRLAGTYVLDANRSKQVQINYGKGTRNYYDWEAEEAALIATPKKQPRSYWRWMQQHPNMSLMLVALFSMTIVLITLVGTQVYIQTQANQRAEEQQNNQQFLNLVKQLNSDSATLEERQKAIVVMGTLQTPQALQALVALLGQEKNYTLLDTLEQALASNGLKALPYLQGLNQSLSQSLESRSATLPEQTQTERLKATQQAIARILTLYSGNVHTVNLNRINLGTETESGFNLVLDQIDLSGIQLRAANLNNASLRNSQFRAVGKNNRWSPSEGWIADLSDTQMKGANISGANLSHVLMNRTNLVLANLNRANLSYARLTGANLSSTKLVGANLQAAVLADSSLTGADLGEAVFNQADLHAARLGRVSALGTKLQSANLTKSDWRGSDLSQADFSGANLRDADFSDTRLAGANLRDTQMINVNLRNADLSLADLRGANLAGADLQGAIFIRYQSDQDQQFTRMNVPKSQSVLVKGVDFSQVRNLAPKQVAYICNQGGLHPRCP